MKKISKEDINSIIIVNISCFGKICSAISVLLKSELI